MGIPTHYLAVGFSILDLAVGFSILANARAKLAPHTWASPDVALVLRQVAASRVGDSRS